MSTSQSSRPQPLVAAGLVVAGLLAVALLTQISTGPYEPVELGSTPATSVSCDWLEGAEPQHILSSRRGVIEADIELDRAAILDSALVDFDPTSVWLRVEVDSGPYSRGLEHRVSPHRMAEGPAFQTVTVHFDAVYGGDPPAPTCSVTVTVS